MLKINKLSSIPKEFLNKLHGESAIIYWTDFIILDGKFSINKDNSIYFCYNNSIGEKGNAENLLGYNKSILILTKDGIDGSYLSINFTDR